MTCFPQTSHCSILTLHEFMFRATKRKTQSANEFFWFSIYQISHSYKYGVIVVWVSIHERYWFHLKISDLNIFMHLQNFKKSAMTCDRY